MNLKKRIDDLEARLGVDESVHLQMPNGKTATVAVRTTETLDLVIDAMERHYRGDPLPPRSALIQRSISDDADHRMFDLLRAMRPDEETPNA